MPKQIVRLHYYDDGRGRSICKADIGNHQISYEGDNRDRLRQVMLVAIRDKLRKNADETEEVEVEW